MRYSGQSYVAGVDDDVGDDHDLVPCAPAMTGRRGARTRVLRAILRRQVGVAIFRNAIGIASRSLSPPPQISGGARTRGTSTKHSDIHASLWKQNMT
jgi:hypothetical protein